MANVPICKLEDTLYFLSESRREYVNQRKLHSLDIESTNRCAGSCTYCLLSSTPEEQRADLPKEILLRIIDEASDFGVKSLLWSGGDPLLHPHLFEVINYSIEKGLGASVWTSGLISKKVAKQLASLDNPNYEGTGIHIDTINQEAYNKVHTNPKTLEKKIQGYRNLLEAGFPPEKILLTPTLTRPIMDTFEETIDWAVDEMGAKQIILCAFKPWGFGEHNKEFETSLSDIRRAHEYVAKKLGREWLRIGATPYGSLFCQSFMSIIVSGIVLPCGGVYPEDMAVGNIYQESIQEIFEKHRDIITYNRKIKGKCGQCENNDVCIGCRGNANIYLGDMWASDPKCWLNPEAKEYYLS